MSEGLVVASAAKATVGENFANDSTTTTPCLGVNQTTVGRTTLACTDPSGTINISVDAGASALVTFDLVPDSSSKGVVWDCGNASDDKYVPAECRG
ncbi:Pilin-like competence factor ComP [compost metagenome]